MSDAREITLYNSLTRRKELFKPLQPSRIHMYVCGITVYDYCHIGHARMLVAFDVITRYLRAAGYDVKYVRNITDIDDKIMNRARENGESIGELSERFITVMHEDERALGILPPDEEPRATGHIAEIIDLVERLIARDCAYAADNGDVYYAVQKFDEYGKLSGRNPEELLAGARIEVNEAKRDPRDFVLWKSSTEDEPGWSSPWGRGRPGWHIECSAMSQCALGETFDIHGGGVDLVFPHHENEIAQSEGATGKPFANYWMHNGAVRIDGEKMSKSLDNFFTIREVLAKYQPEVVRYMLLSSHYRSPINFSDETLSSARQALGRFYQALRDVPLPTAATGGEDPFSDRFHAAMCDDFNTPEALAALFELTRELNTARASGDAAAPELAARLRQLGGVLGLLQDDPVEFLQGAAGEAITAEAVEALIAERQQAKRDKHYARADEIRQQLSDAGISLEDSREGTSWRRI